MPLLDSLLHSPQATAAPIILGIVGSALLLVARYRLRSTTLTAPLIWGVAALGVLTWSCVHGFMTMRSTSPAELHEALSTWHYLRYSAAVLVIAPTLAQLGAKSPQNAAWQFIVLTLVAVLLLPVLQGWAYGDERPSIHGLFRWLLLAHVFLGVGNYLFTRYGIAALLLGIGELLLIAEYLPIGARPESLAREVGGLALLTAAIVAAFAAAAFGSRKAASVERIWSDFRDAFGAVWTLRIAERLNASAQSHAWPVEFSWRGVAVKSGGGNLASLAPALRHRIERELRSYLRRFVSHDWIAARLPPAEVRE
jgi:hypothetical protein